MAKRFFYVCAGLLMLSGAFAIGANSVTAQIGPYDFTGITTNANGTTIAMTAVGEIYAIGDMPIGIDSAPYVNWFHLHRGDPHGEWIYMGSVNGAPVSSEAESLGGLKSQYR